VRELEEKYKDDPNIEIRTEVKVNTPNGEKGSRYLDVAAINTETGEIVEGTQVGQQNKTEVNGQRPPVSRERKAIRDINSVLPDLKINFRPYND
jgi:hypothetical protein